jgi:acetoacetate decarboxylase
MQTYTTYTRTTPTATRDDGAGPLRRLYRMMMPKGFLYEDAHYLASEVELDPKAARRFVPFPLTMGRDPTATVFTGFFPKNTFGSVYHEAGIFFHVKHGLRSVIFCPWMLVDDDVALVTGRELLGYPKKMGEIDWSLPVHPGGANREGDRIHGVASRRGTVLIRQEGTLGGLVTGAPPVLGRPHRNVRTSMGLALPKMIAFTPEETPIAVREVDVKLSVNGSERDPLHEMGLGRVRRTLLYRVNLGGKTLPIPIHAVPPVWNLKQLLLRSL